MASLDVIVKNVREASKNTTEKKEKLTSVQNLLDRLNSKIDKQKNLVEHLQSELVGFQKEAKEEAASVQILDTVEFPAAETACHEYKEELLQCKEKVDVAEKATGKAKQSFFDYLMESVVVLKKSGDEHAAIIRERVKKAEADLGALELEKNQIETLKANRDKNQTLKSERLKFNAILERQIASLDGSKMKLSRDISHHRSTYGNLLQEIGDSREDAKDHRQDENFLNNEFVKASTLVNAKTFRFRKK